MRERTGERRDHELVSYVETARGPVELSSLGRVLMHEHVFVTSPEVQANWALPDGLAWDEADRVAAAAERLNELYAAGIGTLVDLTVVGLGRDVRRIARVAALTDLNIVVATGLYVLTEIQHPFYYHGPGTALGGPEPLTDLFISDIEDGIAGTGIKAAMLKCVTDTAGLTPGVERVLRATARPHRRTGAPISTHTDAATRRGLDQQRIFDDEGVDLGRVIVGHSGDTTDLDYLEELIRRGSWLGMDRFGVDVFLSFEDRVKVVAELCARGHHDRILLSHDTSCFDDGLPPAAVAAALPRWNYLHILRDVVPARRDRGVTAGQIDTMLVANPRRVFEDRTKY
jgi:phosphotriesterase-related protein